MHNSVSPAKNVLIIDDEQYQTRVLGMLLQTRGYDVQTAFSGNEAFAKISPEYDLIILDLAIPDMNGFEICRVIKQNETLCHIPVLVLSAYSLGEDRLKSFCAGADDFLAKPCEHEELFAKMEAILRRARSRHTPTEERTVLELRRILEDQAIESFYQPIFNLQPFGLLGFETLTRPLASGPLCHPEQFFKMALQYGLYPQIELMAWANAFKAIEKTNDTAKVFLNCNPYFIESPQFLKVRALLNKYRVDPRNIVLEITERSAIPDFELFYDRLREYRELGFNFAVDDLGSGYASLESIVEIQPKYVKIDGHMVRDLGKDDFKRSVMEFVVNFCKKHGITVIAEGIENSHDLHAVRNLGLDAGQGYFLCRPQNTLVPKHFRDLAGSPKFHSNGNSFSI